MIIVCVLGSCSTDLRLNQPRYATLPNIMKARSKVIKKYTPQDLNVDIKPDLEVVQVTEPPKRKAGVILPSVDELIDKLKNEARVIWFRHLQFPDWINCQWFYLWSSKAIRLVYEPKVFYKVTFIDCLMILCMVNSICEVPVCLLLPLLKARCCESPSMDEIVLSTSSWMTWLISRSTNFLLRWKC